ncbi:uncharacterized protein LOC119576439 [Penaeus monodon]|uniref:uncharacterized protein LOC119576439 n=1 Tax=Penaeus monodon TaxID=6687 RepID=UPI0018A76C69|nr:uncharacterized protein LOC119576439 [Penaeus monodon]
MKALLLASAVVFVVEARLIVQISQIVHEDSCDDFDVPRKSELELAKEKLSTLLEELENLRQQNQTLQSVVDALQIAQDAYDDLLSLLNELQAEGGRRRRRRKRADVKRGVWFP